MLNFERLLVWQKAISYAEILVRIADSLPQKYQYSFADQLRRAALSVPSNIAEGAGRQSQRDRSNFYAIAKGSVYETVNIVKLLEKLEGIREFEFDKVYLLAEEICKMLYGLAK